MNVKVKITICSYLLAFFFKLSAASRTAHFWESSDHQPHRFLSHGAFVMGHIIPDHLREGFMPGSVSHSTTESVARDFGTSIIR